MARIYPFRALRYNLAQVSARDVVTEPSDRITPAMQQAYYQRSRYNLARIILRLPELFDGERAVYVNAARDFAAWRESGILAQEREPCVFAYSQRFAAPGQPDGVRERRGFIALGELYDYSQKVVFRHEQTVAKPGADRLNLLRATRAHLGQILMLYSDPARTAEQLLFRDGGGTLPEIEVTDGDGVLHRIWKISDPAKINLLTTTLDNKKLILAEGHSLYEAALNYAKEQAPSQAAEPCERLTSSLPQPAYPEAAAMMTFVNMESEGMVILPTHRVVFGLAGFSPAWLLEALRPCFGIEDLPEGDAARTMLRLGKASGTAFVTITAKGWYLLSAKREAVDEALRDIPPRLRQMDVVQLHSLVLEQLLGISAEAIRDETHVRYLRDAGEAAEQVARGEANVSFLLNPVSLDQLREAAFAGEAMPRNSTDFYPKLLSGLAIYALD